MTTVPYVFFTICAHCGDRIAAVAHSEFEHIDPTTDQVDPHKAEPELRYAIDATCPGCGFPEIGYAPARQQYVCSRCEWAGTERPAA